MIEPAHLWIPERRGSFGDEAVDLVATAGMELDEEQELAVDALLSFGPGGLRVARESAILEGRQNGKTVRVLLPVVAFDLWLGEPDRIMWTAHLFRTSRDAFKEFCTCIAMSPELSRRVKKISYSHGEESIELHPRKNKPGEPAALLEFMARERGGGRGIGGKRVVFDEALILSADAMDALVPALSARSDSQINYGSSAAKENSTQLHKLIQRGQKGGDPSLIWVEYCAPGSWEDPGCAKGTRCPHVVGTEGCKLDDESLWPLANHSIGKRGLTYDNVRSERLTLTPRGFGRERLGWHETPVEAGGAINVAAWTAASDPESKRSGDITIGVDVTPAQDFAAIGLFGLRADGLEHFQLLDYRPGVEWVVGRLVEIREQLAPAAYAMGNATWKALKADLLKKDFELPEDRDEPQRGDVAAVVGGDMAAACGQMLAACRPVVGDDGELGYRFRHLGQPELDQAVASARIRENADSAAWSRKESGGDIAPLVAVSNARWVFRSWAHLIADDYDVLDSIG